MRSLKRIGIDLMGSDNAPLSLLQTASSFVGKIPANIELLAIGSAEYANASPIPYEIAKQTIEMEESPLIALRKKKDASLCVGLRLLKEGKIHAFVSAGNTGALISAAKMILGVFPGLLRPALLALMPTKKRPVAVLDVGANLQARASHLIQFASLGIAYQKAKGIDSPRFGLLNIGSEAVKGTSEIRTAYRALQAHPSFVGNIEGKSVFEGDVDVLITDGFTGNIFLKTAEGIASLILDRLQSHIPQESLQRLDPHLKDLQRHLHYAQYPGALLCGVKGPVIKCHGYSTPKAFANGVLGAIEFASSGFIQILESQLGKFSLKRNF